MVPVLTTERLKLRPISQQDTESIYEYAKDKETTKYMRWKTHESKKETEQFIAFVLEQYRGNEYLDWGIELKEESRFIGTCGLIGVSENHSAEIGFIIHKKYWGKGIAIEASEKIMQYGFEKIGLKQIYARIFKENKNSQNVVRKMGFLPADPSAFETSAEDSCQGANVYVFTREQWMN